LERILVFLLIAGLGFNSLFPQKSSIGDNSWFKIQYPHPFAEVYCSNLYLAGHYNVLSTYESVVPISFEEANDGCPDSYGGVCAVRIITYTGGSNATQLDQQDLNNLGETPPYAILYHEY
jgi:hypothetical protein